MPPIRFTLASLAAAMGTLALLSLLLVSSASAARSPDPEGEKQRVPKTPEGEKERPGDQRKDKDDKDDDFYMRYAVVGTLRFFFDIRKDVLSKEQVMQGMGMLLDAPDVSDFAMDDLRNWKAWDMTDRILDLFPKDSHDNPVIKRAILRFALCSPAPRAAKFVEEQRKKDPGWVSDTEDLLRVDMPLPKIVADPKKK